MSNSRHLSIIESIYDKRCAWNFLVKRTNAGFGLSCWGRHRLQTKVSSWKLSFLLTSTDGYRREVYAGRLVSLAFLIGILGVLVLLGLLKDEFRTGGRGGTDAKVGVLTTWSEKSLFLAQKFKQVWNFISSLDRE